MKIKFNPFVQNASGAMGNMVFYDLDGHPVARKRAEPRRRPPTPAQIAHRALVARAAHWSREAMADPKQKAEYAAACQGHQTPYNLGVRDFMTPPVIKAIDLGSYTGRAGDRLRFDIWDDFEVKAVTVMIRDGEGSVIEQGAAARTCKDWEYIATTGVAPGSSACVEVVATDRPGNRTETRQWQHFATDGSGTAPQAQPEQSAGGAFDPGI